MQGLLKETSWFLKHLLNSGIFLESLLNSLPNDSRLTLQYHIQILLLTVGPRLENLLRDFSRWSSRWDWLSEDILQLILCLHVQLNTLGLIIEGWELLQSRLEELKFTILVDHHQFMNFPGEQVPLFQGGQYRFNSVCLLSLECQFFEHARTRIQVHLGNVNFRFTCTTTRSHKLLTNPLAAATILYYMSITSPDLGLFRIPAHIIFSCFHNVPWVRIQEGRPEHYPQLPAVHCRTTEVVSSWMKRSATGHAQPQPHQLQVEELPRRQDHQRSE